MEKLSKSGLSNRRKVSAYVLTTRGTDGTPPNAELQERMKAIMAKMGVSFEEFQEVEQRMSQEERQTFFGESETKI